MARGQPIGVHETSGGAQYLGECEPSAHPTHVLVVDDEVQARVAMKRFLERGGFVVEAVGGFQEAVSALRSGHYDVVVSDIYMPPGASGFDLLDHVHSDHEEAEVVLVTGHSNVETVLEAMRKGAADVIVKPVTAERLCGAVQHAASMKAVREENRRYRERIETLLRQRTQEVREGESLLATIVGESLDGIVVSDLEGHILFLNPTARRYLGKTLHQTHDLPLPELLNGSATTEATIEAAGEPRRVLEVRVSPISWAQRKALLLVLRDVTAFRRAFEDRAKALERTLQAIRATAEALANAVEMRDPYTAGHQRRVTHLACAIHEDMGLPEEEREGLRIAGMVHDLGKLQVPSEILVKPGRLTDLEYRLLQGHCRAGYDILKTIDFPWPVAQIVVQHHERLDGSGYPDGLTKDDLLIESRILGVADVVEAMASHRPYRPALGLDAAFAEIEHNAGILYDPDVVHSCIAVFRRRSLRWP